ncbi:MULTISPECIES: BMP family ABC transporter substrate-binding protein [unclassified Pseudonocardia]|uniref:BMP family lipoprotein n=1 Tax=unclassified Pseudonocardia TaxID=2619320 RepID=UPI0025D83C66|nr:MULTISPECIES: BMP family ABC transporter substrate-binding protein [unclassified Pseudonocardia]
MAAVVLAVVLAVAGCAGPPPQGSTACAKRPTPQGISAGTTPTLPPPLPRSNASALRVGVAYDIGGRGDGSFSDTAAAGLDRAAAQLGLVRADTRELAAATGEGDAAAAARLDQLVADGYNPVIAVGSTYASAVRAAATAHPAVKFAIVDDDSVVLPNVTPLVFAEEQSSFLVGAAAALKTTACHVGFVGGARTPGVQKFEAGYVQGAKYVAPDITVDVAYVSPADDRSGFNDPEKARSLAKDQYDRGADIVYGAAGASGKGVFQAAQAAGRRAIGVDADQYLAPGYAPFRPVIMTSALKRIDTAVYDYINAVAAGDLSTIPLRFDLGDGGVGYATSGGMIDDIQPYLVAYATGIVNGTIKVATTPTS